MLLISRLKIGSRLAFCFSIILILLIVISVVSLARINSLSEASRQFIEEDVNQVTLAAEINIQAQAAALNLLQILLTADRENRVPLYKAMDTHNAALEKLINALDRNFVDQSRLNQILEARETFHSSLIETVNYVELSTSRAFSYYNENTRQKLDFLLAKISSLLSHQQSLAQGKQRQSEASNRQATFIVISLSIFALGLVGVLATLVSRSIVLPLRETVAIARKITNGELVLPEQVIRYDEIGELNNAFRSMCGGLIQLISSIGRSADQITVSSDSLRVPVNHVQKGSEHQRTAVNRIEQVVSKFTKDTERAVTAAIESKKQAEKSMNLANEGKGLIDKTTSEFDKISYTISNSAQIVESLRDHAISVSSLVNTVREIAEKTNLLALNAAIEAARAGESGRGFSVVADEVRMLAGKASQATIEIDTVIESIVKETKSAADRIGKGRNEMEDGVALLKKMVQPLSDLSAGAQISLNQLQELEQAVSEQAKESNEITFEVQNIASMAEENKDAVRSVTAATTSLNELSDSLGAQVKKFQII